MIRSDAATRRLVAWLLAFVGAWTALSVWLYPTPPIDNVEQLVWREALAWGYYKHPPLPTWLLAAASPAWPATPLLTYALSAGSMVLTLLLFHATVRRLLGRGDALLAVLGALCLTYATDRLPIYNHNVVMLPLIAGTLSLLWRVTERPRVRTWAAIGVLLGLGMLAKYQMALVALCMLAWWVRIGGWRSPAHRRGLALAVFLATLVFAPHLLWLAHADWAPLSYASDSSLGAHLPLADRPAHVLLWVADWMGNRLAPAWVLVFSVAGMLGCSRARAVHPPGSAPGRLKRDFLLLAGFGPMAIMASLCLAGGIFLQMKWSTAFALWTLPAVLVLLPRRWRLGDAAPPPATWWLWVALQAALFFYTLRMSEVSARGPMDTGGWKQRDFAVLARTITGETDRVDLINGPYGMAGMLARHLPGRPRVLIDGQLARSPWLSAIDLEKGRIISVWPTCHPPAEASALAPGWAWWPHPAPPPLDPRYRAAEDRLRRAAQHSGGTAVVACP
ncbi:glycosyltransferase family 39 protein [Ottowia sp. GY511]|uniref:Glycosyltransferase family 39 protein n=1 Tax=Ottowia flava TaxID=2675430 RepID=A0ABW4KTG5_9BURK|nr:glycosyltransferase family 39 protein [Ottowia sp. GY511]TXK31004.1 glycosyltransferase family 39 protein [Ottowia sp. GY511]